MSKIFLFGILIISSSKLFSAGFSEAFLCEKLRELSDKYNVPQKPLKDVLFYYYENQARLSNKHYISIADFSQNSTKKRFYLIGTRTWIVEKYKVSHGSGKVNGRNYGDPNDDGRLDRCTHTTQGNFHGRQNMTRPGFFKTLKLYYSGGSHVERRDSQGVLIKGWPNVTKSPKRNGLKLHGLNKGINDLAQQHGVVMHGAYYNDRRNTGRDRMGRSWGCPAFHPDKAATVINRIKRGSLYYSYAPVCKTDHKKIISQSLKGIKEFCSNL